MRYIEMREALKDKQLPDEPEIVVFYQYLGHYQDK